MGHLQAMTDFHDISRKFGEIVGNPSVSEMYPLFNLIAVGTWSNFGSKNQAPERMDKALPKMGYP